MYLFTTIFNFLILISFQILIIKFLNLKKNWHILTFFVYTFICIILKDTGYSFYQNIEYFLFNFIILISYIIFLTLVFNDSPSLVYLQNSIIKNFVKKRFVRHRLALMKNMKLIKNKKITSRGNLTLILTNLFSDLFLKEND